MVVYDLTNDDMTKKKIAVQNELNEGIYSLKDGKQCEKRFKINSVVCVRRKIIRMWIWRRFSEIMANLMNSQESQ